MRLVKLVEKTGILLVLGTGFFAPKAVAEITVYNVNAIHELYSENELAAKKIYHNKNALVYGRVDKVDNEHVIIEVIVNLDAYSADTAVKIWTKSFLFEKTAG